jgi:hypothetical protein
MKQRHVSYHSNSDILADRIAAYGWQTPTLVAYRNGIYVAGGFKALEYEGNPEYQVAKLFKVWQGS